MIATAILWGSFSLPLTHPPENSPVELPRSLSLWMDGAGPPFEPGSDDLPSSLPRMTGGEDRLIPLNLESWNGLQAAPEPTTPRPIDPEPPSRSTPQEFRPPTIL